MSNQISEDVPAPSSSSASAGAGGSQEKLEKQARQLAYDVKYKVKQQMNRGTKMDPAAVKKAYLSFLGKSTGTPAVKALAKKKLIGEELVQEELEKKYKIRVTDKQTGNTYVRMATRAKIAELRANTNIASVEMTGYGEPTRSEKTKGSQTAAAKAGKDYDGDGKKESSSKEHAGVVHNAIQKKKGGKQDGQDTRKEEFIADANNNKEDIDKQIKELKGKKNKVKIMPTMGEDAKHGYDKDGNSLNPDDVKKKNEKDPNGEAKKQEEEDPRSMGTKYRNMKNKLRAMGLNMGFDISGKKLDEEVPVDAKQEKNDKDIESKQKKADIIKRQVLLKKIQAVRAGGGASVTASYKPEGEMVDEAIGAIAAGAAKVAGKAAVTGAKFAGKTAAYLGKKAGNRIGKELVKATSDVDNNADKEFDKVKVKRYKETPVKEQMETGCGSDITNKGKKKVNPKKNPVIEAMETDEGGPGTGDQQQKQIDSKQKKADQIKKQVLLKKLQAVRQGGGSDIMASYDWRSDKSMRINKLLNN